jgi:choline dehydrogenase-like flavoprotein
MATREIILSAGAVHTPKLLMLSGVGDATHLAAFNQTVLVHSPGVGQNLQVHRHVYVYMWSNVTGM